MFAEAHALGKDHDAPLDYCRAQRSCSLGIDAERVMQVVAVLRLGGEFVGSPRDLTRLRYFVFFSPTLDLMYSTVGTVSDPLSGTECKCPVEPEGRVGRFSHGPPHVPFPRKETKAMENQI